MKKYYNRREIIKMFGASALGAITAPYTSFASEIPEIAPTADTVILLWMAGGMAHTETFDPKTHQELTPGLDSRKLLSTFKTISSNVDNIKLSAGLENLAQVMDKAAIIRSLVNPDLGKVLHTRHQYHWHTGYVPPLTVAAPHIGSVISRTLGPKNPDLPAFIEIGQKIDGDGAEEINSFMTSGFLGREHSPFRIPYPSKAKDALSLPKGYDVKRFQNRSKYFKKLAKSNPYWEASSGFQRDGILSSIETADRILTSDVKKSFDLSLEPKEIYDKYNTSKFGLGCLLARRLTEAGARFIEVSSEYIAFGNWDTHNNGHERTVSLKKWIDVPVSQLIKDLDERGLLKRTLVVIASEFSRTAGRNPGGKGLETDIVIKDKRQYGMHRHFPKAGSVVMFGGGIKGGTVYGETNNVFPCETVVKPVKVMDIHASIYSAMGISPKTSYDIEERPFYVTQDGLGKVIKEIF